MPETRLYAERYVAFIVRFAYILNSYYWFLHSLHIISGFTLLATAYKNP